jgi:hypothetical protein
MLFVYHIFVHINTLFFFNTQVLATAVRFDMLTDYQAEHTLVQLFREAVWD